jgi:hypothetical protein
VWGDFFFKVQRSANNSSCPLFSFYETHFSFRVSLAGFLCRRLSASSPLDPHFSSLQTPKPLPTVCKVGNVKLMSRLVLGASHGGSQAADPVLLQNLIDMGFEEAASRAALEQTSNRSLEFAIDFIMNNPSSQTVQPSSSAQPSSIAQPAPLLNEPQHSQQPLFAQQTSVSAAAQKPAEKLTSKLTSSFDLAAREAHQKKEMEERTRVVREEQKRKKEHEKKVKQQLEEDKMIRKMKPVAGRAKTLSATEINEHVEAIRTFVAENGRPCDVLADLVETLKAHIVSQQTAASETPTAGAHQAAAPSVLAAVSGGGRPCQIRLRLSDGSQVIQTLQSNQALQVLHDFVKERQGGDGSFSFIVPGPPGLRSELGEDKLGLTLEELGLAPSASLTVQATSKKDLVTVAPEGALFVSAQAGMRMSYLYMYVYMYVCI